MSVFRVFRWVRSKRERPIRPLVHACNLTALGADEFDDTRIFRSTSIDLKLVIVAPDTPNMEMHFEALSTEQRTDPRAS